jgi:hypothetical protein
MLRPFFGSQKRSIETEGEVESIKSQQNIWTFGDSKLSAIAAWLKLKCFVKL